METQVAETIKERVCGLACWLSQAFDYDLSTEDKALLKDFAVASRNNGEILHIVMNDLATQPSQPLVGRLGFGQIFRALCEYIRTIPKSHLYMVSRQLTDTDGLWRVLIMGIGPEMIPADANAKIRSYTNKDEESLVVNVINDTGDCSCMFVLSLDTPTMPRGRNLK